MSEMSIVESEKFKISIIVPCYNVEDRVEACLDSLLSQSIGTDALEIILVDDASSDNTVSILKEYEERYPDIIMIILCNENGRQGKARNIGLDYASGDWISFVDADDMVHEQMYEILMNIAKRTEPELITFSYTSDKSAMERIYNTNETECEIYDLSLDESRRQFVLNGNLINNSCTQKFYKAELIQLSGVRYAEGVSYEEPLFTYPLRYLAERVVVTDLSLYYYQLNPNGTINMRLSDPGTVKEHLSVQSMLLDFMRGMECYSRFKNEINLNFIHCFGYEPYIFLTKRGFNYPDGLCKGIGKILAKEIPNWWENPYINSVPVAERDFLISKYAPPGIG